MTEAVHGPLLTADVHAQLTRALKEGAAECACSLDLEMTQDRVTVHAAGFSWRSMDYPWPSPLKPRTIYYWTGRSFEPVSVYAGSLIKLVPTPWGAPTFEIDGIKMLPSAKLSPFEDARRKVELVGVGQRRVLDTCGGLGYFAQWCLRLGAARIVSFEKNAQVLWLREHNPWSPQPNGALEVSHGAVDEEIRLLLSGSFDVVLHDPPRFARAGELYSAPFYKELARVLKPGGTLFHYTGSPNRLTSGRDVPAEVIRRLTACGFRARRALDGVLAQSVLKPVR